jgi:HPt (histidine-containing phosphotransfer) domain-containing protein
VPRTAEEQLVNLDKSRQIQLMRQSTPDEEFEKLRQRFHQRLLKEKAQLAALGESLGKAHGASESIFVDIRGFAHRLRGAALVFGFKALGDGAKAVELAAIAVSVNVNGRRDIPSVAATMQALAINLANEIGTDAPCAAATHSTVSSGESSSW